MKQLSEVVLTIAVSALWFLVIGQTSPPSIDDEISRLRKDLIRTQVDCQRVIEETRKDKTDFEAYRNRTEVRRNQSQTEIDTLKQEIANQQRSNDELASQVNDIQTQRREIELSQEEFRKRLVDVCGRIEPSVKTLPPVSMAPMLSALSLLASDLSVKSVDIVEGCSRLVQILNRLDETSSSIQIVQESSPAPDIRGTVYRLRIGSFFEAVVDIKGEKCALFEGWDNEGAPQWKTVGDLQTAQALLLAVNIREGRSLPSFVTLPLAPDSVQKGGL
jgi:hypothetical protein